jgi:hypothetical protein
MARVIGLIAPAATRTTLAESNVIPAQAGKRKKAKKGM